MGTQSMIEQVVSGYPTHAKCHSLASARYYLKSRSDIVRLISCLPKSNKGLKDDYLVASGEWHDGLYCPVRAGKPSGVP